MSSHDYLIAGINAAVALFIAVYGLGGVALNVRRLAMGKPVRNDISLYLVLLAGITGFVGLDVLGDWGQHISRAAEPYFWAAGNVISPACIAAGVAQIAMTVIQKKRGKIVKSA